MIVFKVRSPLATLCTGCNIRTKANLITPKIPNMRTSTRTSITTCSGTWRPVT